MTRVISVVSGKGGVGKTTVSVNLATALAQQDNEVLVIDGNLSGANVAQHFGTDFQDVTLNEVLEGEAYITQAVAKHPEGVSVLPASILDFGGDAENLKHAIVDFLGDKDFVFIDAAAGVNEETQAAIEAGDEVLLVSEPEVPSLTNALGAKKLAKSLDREVIGLVLNSVREEKTEVRPDKAEELIGESVIEVIPDHEHVREGIAAKEPVVTLRPNTLPAAKIKDLAHKIQGDEPPERTYPTRLKHALQKRDII